MHIRIVMQMIIQTLSSNIQHKYCTFSIMNYFLQSKKLCTYQLKALTVATV